MRGKYSSYALCLKILWLSSFTILSCLVVNRTQSLVRRLIRIVIETMAMPTLCMTMTAVMGLYYVSLSSVTSL